MEEEIMLRSNIASSVVTIAIVAATGALPGSPSAHAAASDGAGTAAFFFSYSPKPGEVELFEEGYRRHLSWHEEQDDPLPWYGWTVTSGERVGLFIDASVGVPFEAFDQRVELQADIADFAQTTAPFAEPESRNLYRLRRDLSTGEPLEERRPSPIVEVPHYVLRPGTELRFAEVLAALAEALKTLDDAPVHTWYELEVGGEQPAFMLMVPRSGWADFAPGGGSMAEILTRVHGPEEA
ncbi:MAG: hypothetical protein ACLF0P_09460 [Thermoanaerobaculia bacterium]